MLIKVRFDNWTAFMDRIVSGRGGPAISRPFSDPRPTICIEAAIGVH
jgi:hypothetical protein